MSAKRVPSSRSAREVPSATGGGSGSGGGSGVGVDVGCGGGVASVNASLDTKTSSNDESPSIGPFVSKSVESVNPVT